MTTAEKTKREIFLECNWSYDFEKFQNYYYSSILLSLDQAAYDMEKAGKEEHFKILRLLSNIASLYLDPESIHNPYTPQMRDYENNRTSFRIDLLTVEDLDCIESILDVVNQPLLKGRLADILWILRKPKNPKHALSAIDSYLQIRIDNYWYRGIDRVWERAIRLCKQLRNSERESFIKKEMFKAFEREISNTQYKFLSLMIARLMDEEFLDDDCREKIAYQLFNLATQCQSSGDYELARQCYDLAFKKYKQCNDAKWIDALVNKALCYELEAAQQTLSIRANAFYGDALEAYRRIPKKNRIALGLENKPEEIQKKITKTGKAALEEMYTFKTDEVDVTPIADAIIKFVSDKGSPENAFVYFIKIYDGPLFKSYEQQALAFFNESFCAGLAGAKHLAGDGRTVEIVPSFKRNAPLDDAQNVQAIKAHMFTFFKSTVETIAQSRILPALFQISKEFRIEKSFLRQLCMASPIVPKDRVKLVADALYYGFEYDFSTAIQLLCPQIENIVRVQLLAHDGLTSTIEKGIQNEVGLSSLMDRPQIQEIFGRNLAFEIECIFTQELGYNLRNKVAHGLLNDDDASSSPGSIYGWWLGLRLIMNSLIFRNVNLE